MHLSFAGRHGSVGHIAAIEVWIKRRPGVWGEAPVVASGSPGFLRIICLKVAHDLDDRFRDTIQIHSVYRDGRTGGRRLLARFLEMIEKNGELFIPPHPAREVLKHAQGGCRIRCAQPPLDEIVELCRRCPASFKDQGPEVFLIDQSLRDAGTFVVELGAAMCRFAQQDDVRIADRSEQSIVVADTVGDGPSVVANPGNHCRCGWLHTLARQESLASEQQQNPDGQPPQAGHPRRADIHPRTN
ncbi:MAG: hypothetical protein CAPSK01_003616 [Candidatus Accumulibacter vicinus]|uniref:Uncharacterized protein n=1 Tax=Candidatus Accumulibacter vicinus TaxID=2954382 RepID=A0A084XX09_9PROT|nr:MAG: hypothetical protein CAPSK01_003616 [Candidatus Accumulibacter vicinus]